MLRRHYLFAACNDDVLARVVAAGRLLTLADGDVLFRRGDPGQSFFFIVEGAIQISSEDSEGSVQVMNVLPADSVFGEIALLDDMPRTADAIARGPTLLFSIAGKDFRGIMFAKGGTEDLLMRLLCERVRWINDLVEQKATLDVERRRNESVLRQWMADTSHELRAPLTALRAQIEALQDGLLSADAKTLGLLHGGVLAMARLVEDLFSLARSDVGRLDCRRDPVDPLAVLSETVDSFRARFVAGGLALEWQPDIAPPATITADAARLWQVFANLLENTLHYTDAGGSLRITATSDGGRLNLIFDDSAPGVSEATLPRLFTRFYRDDQARRRAPGGSGIGLALCRSLIEAMGGAITAAASPLGGLRVVLRLPV